MGKQPKSQKAADLTAASTLQVLLELYKEQCSHGRHTEGQRHLVSAMFLTAAGVLLTVASTNKFSLEMWPICVSVSTLGLLGLMFSRVYEIKWDETGVRRHYYREQLEDLTGILPIPLGFVPRSSPLAKAPKKKPFARLRIYWRLTFLFVIVVGLLATTLSVTRDRQAVSDVATNSKKAASGVPPIAGARPRVLP